MTYEESLEIITNAIQTDKMTSEQDIALSMAQKAIEKQIRKKPDLVEFTGAETTTVAYCPSCGNSFGELRPFPCIYVSMQLSAYRNGEATACNCCGQAIDWSDYK